MLNILLSACLCAGLAVLSSCANSGSSGEEIVVKPKPKPRYVHRMNPPVNLPVGAVNGITHRYGSRTTPYVALTFDDGPHPVHTPRLLNILKAHNVKATFYVVGRNVDRYPHIARRIVAEGHEIGNHTYTHVNLTKVPHARVKQELDKSVVAIANATGVKSRTFRPPYGAIRSNQKAWIHSHYGYPTIMWAVDPLDWKDRNASIVSSRIINRTKPGAILLLHDIHKTSIDAVPSIINGLLARGYKFATVSQLISNK